MVIEATNIIRRKHHVIMKNMRLKWQLLRHVLGAPVRTLPEAFRLLGYPHDAYALERLRAGRKLVTEDRVAKMKTYSCRWGTAHKK